MTDLRALGALLLAGLWLAPEAAQAQWAGTGEIGLAAARGNARSENLNGRLNFSNEDERWKHDVGFSVLRAKGEIRGDFDGDGIPDTRFELTANRWALGASSALKMNERSSWVSALRHERDDFGAYDHQSTLSIGYGYQFYDRESGSLRAELGPGYRRAKLQNTGDTESDLIGRALVNFQQRLTENTTLGNVLLVEAGDDNTFAQNDLGVQVSMNSRMALKAGLQARYNSENAPGIKSTDLLTTINLVYSFR